MHKHTDYINLIYTQLKMGSKQRLETDEDTSMEWKAWQVYSFGKRNVLRSEFGSCVKVEVAVLGFPS